MRSTDGCRCRATFPPLVRNPTEFLHLPLAEKPADGSSRTVQKKHLQPFRSDRIQREVS
jgi:hypothetical protein